jgi:hypothetical protein
VSCITAFIPELANAIPVKPPSVNKNKNPIQKSIAVSKTIDPFQSVAIQLKIFIPVGTAIIIVAAVKYALVSTSKPTVNI